MFNINNHQGNADKSAISPQRYLQVWADCSTTHNSQVIESAWGPSMDGWMDRENVAYVHNGILFSHLENEILSFEWKWMNWRSSCLMK
jgi:hypothetical protein